MAILPLRISAEESTFLNMKYILAKIARHMKCLIKQYLYTKQQIKKKELLKSTISCQPFSLSTAQSNFSLKISALPSCNMWIKLQAKIHTNLVAITTDVNMVI